MNSTARPYDQPAFSPLDPTYIHIRWFNFDALAQGNAYKPTKEPINYHGPSGDRTHDLQTEATPPAASCPARTLHVTEIASKNATPMTCPRLHWTTDNPSGMHRCKFQHLCVNFELRPGAGDIHICCYKYAKSIQLQFNGHETWAEQCMTLILASKLFWWVIWMGSWMTFSNVANGRPSKYGYNIKKLCPCHKMTKGPTMKYLIWTTQRQHIAVVDIPQSLYVFIYHRIIIRSVMNVDAIATVSCGNMPKVRLPAWKELSINLAHLIRKLIVYRHDSLIMPIILDITNKQVEICTQLNSMI